MKDTITKINTRELAENQLKKVQTIKLIKASRYKLENKVVQKKEIITIKKAWEKIVDRKTNEMAIILRALVGIKKTAHNTIVEPCLLIF